MPKRHELCLDSSFGVFRQRGLSIMMTSILHAFAQATNALVSGDDEQSKEPRSPSLLDVVRFLTAPILPTISGLLQCPHLEPPVAVMGIAIPRRARPGCLVFTEEGIEAFHNASNGLACARCVTV